MTPHGAHASTLMVAGRAFAIRRTHQLICEVEARFGYLVEFGERLEGMRVKFDELFLLYQLMLKSVELPPTDDELWAHLGKVGLITACGDAYKIVTVFFLGEERFMARAAEMAKADPPNPRQPPQAMSAGASFSEPPPDWDGEPPISGAPLSTISPLPFPRASATERRRA